MPSDRPTALSPPAYRSRHDENRSPGLQALFPVYREVRQRLKDVLQLDIRVVTAHIRAVEGPAILERTNDLYSGPDELDISHRFIQSGHGIDIRSRIRRVCLPLVQAACRTCDLHRRSILDGHASCRLQVFDHQRGGLLAVVVPFESVGWMRSEALLHPVLLLTTNAISTSFCSYLTATEAAVS